MPPGEEWLPMSMASQQNNDSAFLTAILWPKDVERDAVVRAMAQQSGLDEHTLRLKSRQHPPAILAMVPQEVARRALTALLEHGGDGFAPTMNDLHALGPTLKIKDLRLESGGFVAELWRGATQRIEPKEILALIRGQLSEVKVDPMPELSFDYIGQGLSARAYSTYSFGGSYGAAVRFSIDYADDFSNARGRRIITTSSKLDIHTHDGRVFQIDGDKFGYRILGEQRGHSDLVNVDRMCELFTHMAPDAVVDPYFSLWHPPPGHDRLRISQRNVNNDDPAFAFYSRWAALMYRHLLKLKN